MKNYFTIYWKDGTKNIISGNSIEEAFTVAGYSAGVLKGIVGYSEGVEDTHYWDADKNEWLKYIPLHIYTSDFQTINNEQLIQFFNKRQHIIVVFENKDQLEIKNDWGCFAEVGWVNHISVLYAEYQQGTYAGDSDNEENEHHYMVNNTEYFKPSDVNSAVAAFIERANKGGFHISSSKDAKTIAEIAEAQAVKYL